MKREAGGNANVNFPPPNARVFAALQRTHPRSSQFESQHHHHSIQTIVFHLWTPKVLDNIKKEGIHNITEQEMFRILHDFCVTKQICRSWNWPSKLCTDCQMLFLYAYAFWIIPNHGGKSDYVSKGILYAVYPGIMYSSQKKKKRTWICMPH